MLSNLWHCWEGFGAFAGCFGVLFALKGLTSWMFLELKEGVFGSGDKNLVLRLFFVFFWP